MKKREFLKIGAVGIAGLTFAPRLSKAASFGQKKRLKVSHVFSSFNDVSEFIHANDLEIHYKKHYLQSEKSLIKLMDKHGLNPPLINIYQKAQSISTEVLDNAGEFTNHRLFWRTISKTNQNVLSDSLKYDIENSFGSVQNFVLKFTFTAKELKENEGWIWLVKSKGKLQIVKTHGNVNPFFSNLPSDQQGYPLFCLDMWKHAYENQYPSVESYCEAFFKTINWNFVSKRHKKTS
jgi:Fe-Mn family superoxide dismutase